MRALPGDGMTRIRILAILVTALTAGGGLAAGTYRYLQNVPVKEISVPTRPVVVATANLPLAAELKANDLVVVDWPVDSVPEGVFPSENELVGRGLIDSVVKYKPILAAKLAPEGAGVGLPPVIPPGMRALPQPEGPEMETYSPFRMSRSILSSACVSTSSVKKNLGHGLEVNERLSSFVHDLSRSSSTELGRTRPTPTCPTE